VLQHMSFQPGDGDVYALTSKGEQELNAGQTLRSHVDLELLVCIDGKVNLAALRSRIPGAHAARVADSIRGLLLDGLISPAGKTQGDALEFTFTSARSAQAHGESAAAAEADGGLSSLQQQGYYVRIARRSSKARVAPEGGQLSVVIVEDEDRLGRFLGQFLALEGFATRLARNRGEIIAEFRRAPRPDLVLLDVVLPDADGFDILSKLKSHAVLGELPVIMLTARATRDSVLRGLMLGADGYVTKPFQMEVLLKAIQTVMGLDAEKKAPIHRHGV